MLARAQAQPRFHLVVVGAGAGGVEVALAARHAFSRAAPAAQVTLVAADTGLLPGHAPSVQRACASERNALAWDCSRHRRPPRRRG